MKLVIIAGAGCSYGFYKNVTKELKDIYTDIELLLPLGNDLDEINNTIYNKLKRINEDFVLLGHCLGGVVAIDIVTNKHRLSNIKKLILVNTYSDFTFLNADFLSKSNENINNYTDEAVENVKDSLLEHNILNKQIGIALNSNLSNRLNSIDLQTLIIGSENDGLFSPEKLSYMNSVLKSSELHIIKNARHLALLTHIDEVKNIIRRWDKPRQENHLEDYELFC